LSLRSVVRRSKRVAFRRERVPVEIAPEGSAAEEVGDDLPDSEKIEVHVHVHRGDGPKRRPTKRRAPEARGKLFDWQWYNEQLAKRPRHAMQGRWAASATCTACGGLIPSSARGCPRCGAPRARRRLLPLVMALMGLAGFAVVLAIGARMLGGSVPSESQTFHQVGHWSDDDIVIVEMPPATPSPFGTTMPPPSSPSSGGNVATR
jgi:hypothetical protein